MRARMYSPGLRRTSSYSVVHENAAVAPQRAHYDDTDPRARQAYHEEEYVTSNGSRPPVVIRSGRPYGRARYPHSVRTVQTPNGLARVWSRDDHDIRYNGTGGPPSARYP